MVSAYQIITLAATNICVRAPPPTPLSLIFCQFQKNAQCIFLFGSTKILNRGENWRGEFKMAVAEVSKDGELLVECYLYSSGDIRISTESLRPLLSDEFDAKAFAAGAIHQQMVGEMLHKLSSGITELDNEIYSQVRIYVHVVWLDRCRQAVIWVYKI